MPPPPLLLPPPPPAAIGVSESSQQQQQLHRSSSSRNGLSPSILIVTGLIAFVFVTSASIHLLLRFLSRRNRHPHRSLSTSSSFSIQPPPPPQDPNQKSLIESLPQFSLASALAAVPKSSPDCAVCLSKFDPNDQLRLLPACHHAFHASCIDTWLRTTPSCPLCRSSLLPLPLPPPNSIPNPNTSRSDRSDSFRLEIGSVSRRREEEAAAAQQQIGRSYSLGSSFEYVVEEEIEAVVAHVRRSSKESAPEALAPGEEVAGMVGGSGASWLKEYVDRLAMPASSSFSTMEFSGRWSRRSDGVAAPDADVASGGGGGSWDLERNGGGEDLAVYYSIYRWLVGV